MPPITKVDLNYFSCLLRSISDFKPRLKESVDMFWSISSDNGAVTLSVYQELPEETPETFCSQNPDGTLVNLIESDWVCGDETDDGFRIVISRYGKGKDFRLVNSRNELHDVLYENGFVF
jgi:hypothetical protein